MAKYLVEVSYTPEGIRGVRKDGGSGRRAAIEKAVTALGGRVEVFYFTFGDRDGITILEMPDNVGMAALSLAASASGAVHLKTTVLLTPEEIDATVDRTVEYRPPGT